MRRRLHQITAGFLLMTFAAASLFPSMGSAQTVSYVSTLPAPDARVGLTSGYAPTLMRGIKISVDNPLEFNFIMDRGQEKLEGKAFEKEAGRLIKYFMASLTVPGKDMWVNLSPYEQDRIVPEGFGLTEMGRDVLAQDYLLKQLTSSLMYPEDATGKKFWEQVYARVSRRYGTTEIPVNTLSKVWVVPDNAVVYEQDGAAFVVKSRLKVMMEEDYAANSPPDKAPPWRGCQGRDCSLTADIIREILIPEIEKEINEGKNFAALRQVYHSMILATWYKNTLKESLLGQVYVNRNKVKGVDVEDKDVKQKIYERYLEAFRKGAYNYIREDYDETRKEIVPRKYFSGGVSLDMALMAGPVQTQILQGMTAHTPDGPKLMVLKRGRDLIPPNIGASLQGLKNQVMVNAAFVENLDPDAVLTQMTGKGSDQAMIGLEAEEKIQKALTQVTGKNLQMVAGSLLKMNNSQIVNAEAKEKLAAFVDEKIAKKKFVTAELWAILPVGSVLRSVNGNLAVVIGVTQYVGQQYREEVVNYEVLTHEDRRNHYRSTVEKWVRVKGRPRGLHKLSDGEQFFPIGYKWLREAEHASVPPVTDWKALEGTVGYEFQRIVDFLEALANPFLSPDERQSKRIELITFIRDGGFTTRDVDAYNGTGIDTGSILVSVWSEGALAVVLEVEKPQGRGPVYTVLVYNGTQPPVIQQWARDKRTSGQRKFLQGYKELLPREAIPADHAMISGEKEKNLAVIVWYADRLRQKIRALQDVQSQLERPRIPSADAVLRLLSRRLQLSGYAVERAQWFYERSAQRIVSFAPRTEMSFQFMTRLKQLADIANLVDVKDEKKRTAFIKFMQDLQTAESTIGKSLEYLSRELGVAIPRRPSEEQELPQALQTSLDYFLALQKAFQSLQTKLDEGNVAEGIVDILSLPELAELEFAFVQSLEVIAAKNFSTFNDYKEVYEPKIRLSIEDWQKIYLATERQPASLSAAMTRKAGNAAGLMLNNLKPVIAMFFQAWKESLAKNGSPSDQAMAAQVQEKFLDKTQANVGGIDLDPAKLNLQIKRDGKGIPLPLPLQPRLDQMKIDGFLPIIIKVTPVNVPLLLGLKDVPEKSPSSDISRGDDVRPSLPSFL